MGQVTAQTKTELEGVGWAFQSEGIPDSMGTYPCTIRLATNLYEGTLVDDPLTTRRPVLLYIEGNIPNTEELTVRICHKGRAKRRPYKNRLNPDEGRRTIHVSGSWRIMSSKATRLKYVYQVADRYLEPLYAYTQFAASDELIYRMRLVPLVGRENVYRAEIEDKEGAVLDIAWVDILCGYCRSTSDEDVSRIIVQHGSYRKTVAEYDSFEGEWRIRKAALKDIGLALFDGDKQISEILPVTVNLVNFNEEYTYVPTVSAK